MVKVRGAYPSSLRLIFIALITPLFFFLNEWLLESKPFAFWTTLIFATVLLSYTAVDILPVKFISNIAKRSGMTYNAKEVVSVSAKTVSNKWLFGVSVTTVEFKFPSGKIRMTDTRNPFFPLESGYSPKEARAILLWLSYVPENIEGFFNVEHLREMLSLKHPEEN